jgi:hypothetical protein
VANKYIVSALLAIGLIGNAYADNTANGNPQLTSANINAAARTSMSADSTNTSSPGSVNIEEDLKRTEQQLQADLSRTLAETVNDAIAAN